MPFNNRYFIVNEQPLRIISKCRNHSRGSFSGYAAGICIIFILLNWIPELMSLRYTVTVGDVMQHFLRSSDESLSRYLPATPAFVYIYSFLFTGVFKLSEALFTVTYIRNRQSDYRAIAEGFSFYLKTLVVFAMQVMIISFWSIFFIIPGILASINFSQTFYILADDPSKSPIQVLAESRIMMTGNRMTYVRLLVAYLPYLLGSYIPALVVAELVSGTSIPALPMMIIALISEIPVFIASGYMEMGRCVFYELMINKGFADFKYAGQDEFRKPD